MNANWYVLRSKPHRELFLAGELLARNFEVFCPVLRVKPVNPRARKIKAYFPGYLFIYIDLQSANLSNLSWMPGAVGLVTIGAEPASVPDELVRTIRKKVNAISAAGSEVLAGPALYQTQDGVPHTCPGGWCQGVRVSAHAEDSSKGLQVGDRVLVEDGSFAGYQGIFDGRLPGNDRVRILLDLLKQRQMRLDLPEALVKRIETRR